MMKQLTLILLVAFVLVSCGKKKPVDDAPGTTLVSAPVFEPDSAYRQVSRQVAFGPRVPNTPAHDKAASFLVQTLKRHGAVVVQQEFEATTVDGTRVKLVNIIASHQPQLQKRVLLAAHWDTRPFADKDSVKRNASFDGADDGASGVGVLLEISRLIQLQQPRTGVDIILFDGEDWGEKSGESRPPTPENLEEWWCLGSQHWSRDPHRPGYQAYYGILLDMVGAKNARFFREGLSMQYAPRIVDKVWKTAAALGYRQFIFQNTAPLIDDHKFMNIHAGIPTIDIINYDPAAESFGAHHHTTGDNMDIISKETLRAVGHTVVQVIYAEQ